MIIIGVDFHPEFQQMGLLYMPSPMTEEYFKLSGTKSVSTCVFPRTAWIEH
jgi:hypothetical protein